MSQLYPSDKDLSGSPYYDDYNRDKGYVGLEAIPGRIAQAREFTQIQTMTRDFLGRLGDSLYSNGTIISGCAMVVNDKTLTITSGKIYLDGLVRYVDAQTLPITGVGNESVRARVVTTIVTENEDSSLRDPAQNYENFGQAGAHRIKQTVKFDVVQVDDEDNSEGSGSGSSSSGSSSSGSSSSASSSNGTIIVNISNGDIINSSSSDKEDSATTLAATLARRTYDENGSYKVSGLELIDRSECNENGILISVNQGKAYVNGYEVNKAAATTLTLRYATETRNVRNEPKVFATGTTSYYLNNVPARKVSSVMGVIRVTETMTRGSIAGGIDYMSYTPVIAIQEVKAGAVTYTQGVDFQLSNDGVDWSLTGGTEPAIGTSYSVTYTYNKEMVEGTDWELENTTVDDAYVSRINFINSAQYPVNASTFLVDYDFYLSRKDLIVMTQEGKYVIYEGVPDIARLAESPINQDDTKLVIGTVMVGAGYSGINADQPLKNIITNTYNSTRLSQANLFALKERVDNLEYNTALTDLDTEAAEGESATKLRGIFTDGFIGLTKADTAHKEWNCTIDLDNEELTLPISSGIAQAQPNLTTSSTNIAQIGQVFLAPYKEELVLNQPRATKAFLVNPYSVYNPLSIIKLNPSVDNWIDSSRVIVNNSKTASTSLRRWWYHRGEWWAESEKQKWLQLTGTTGEQLGWSNYGGTTTANSSQIILDEAIMYMRTRDIYVTGSNYLANADNLVCYFNDTLVPLVATGSTTSGTKNGSVKADSSGKFTAKFTVPKYTPCGTVDVVIKNGTNNGTATYTAQGRKQIIQDTVLTTKITVITNDPLAQAFQFDTETTLVKAGLYFANKDANKNVIVEVRNMVNGYPGTTVYDEVVLDSADIKTSNNASAVTYVKFSQPVVCAANTQYCICILSDSNEYEMWVATLGERDVQSNTYVTSQPYTAGVLFSSSNAMTWTAHQDSDLKFELYRAKYTGEKGVVLFKDVATDTMNRLLIAAQSVDTENLGVDWYYRLTSDDSWLPISTYVDQELSKLTKSVQLKVEMNAVSGVSPILAGNTVNLISFIEQNEGAYVSRTVTFDHPFNKIVTSVEAYTPTGTGFSISYSLDGSTWAVMNTPTTATVDEYFIKYTYTVDVPATSKVFKVKINMSTNNPLVRPRIRKLMNILRTE